MQASKIKVGEVYEVEINGLEPATQQLKSPGGTVGVKHAYTTMGVSARWGTKAFAKVLGKGDLVTSHGAYSRYYKLTPDGGWLVEFLEPVEAGRGYSATPKPKVKTAVLSSRHILTLKSEIDKSEAEHNEWAAKQDRATTEKAQAFESEIIATTETLKKAGLNPREVKDGIVFDGGKINFATSTYWTGDKGTVAIGWRGSVVIEREALLKLIG